MTSGRYLADIRRKCDALGTWRDEFDKVAKRLAAVYERIDLAEAEFRASGKQITVTHVNTARAETLSRNPVLIELAALYDQAIVCERELGLTAAALKKLNDCALKSSDRPNGLGAVLKLLEGGG